MRDPGNEVVNARDTYRGLYNYAIFLANLDQEPPAFTYCPSDITIDNAATTALRVNWHAISNFHQVVWRPIRGS